MLNIEKILQTGKTVFSVNDLKNILDTSNEASIRNYLSNAWKKKVLYKLFYWIWGFKNYNLYELACKINKISYISLETVLKKEWVIFQHYWDKIFLVSDKSIEKQANWIIFKTFKIKTNILINPIGIEHINNYSIATKERAICDRLYLSKNYYFDNLENVDFEKLREISQIYNRRVITEVNNLIKKYAK